jgi:tetratricopeptide (TPR) repeat protein
MRPDILIFCDGGLGNRINALASGLAVARYFGLTYCVHWPINNWCAAPFEKIFANRLNVSTESISQLRGKLDDAVMLLHDEIASSTLNVKFESAYRFKDLKDFGELTNLKSKSVFYYPAVIPNWVPDELVNNELRFLKFDTYIVKEVKEFISLTMPGPFYGLHLRRTDLNVGLSDLEVFNLAKSHPEAAFFVCSDDPQAERLAAGHANVFRREKKFQIEKKTIDGDWHAQTQDDDGRFYFGNIQRNENAVVEGSIDMLILAHSHIIGFSGSTFQSCAKKIGLISPLIKILQPLEIQYQSLTDIIRQLNNGSIDIEKIISLGSAAFNKGDKEYSFEILEKLLEKNSNPNQSLILYILGVQYLKDKKFYKSIIYLKQAVFLRSNFALAWLNLSCALLVIGDKKQASFCLNKYNENKEIINEEEAIMYNYIKINCK